MLQNLPIRSKLIAILALPVLVMVLLVFSRWVQNMNNLVRQAEQTSARSPDADEIRQRLSSYQQGFERGRQEVSGTDADGEQGPETPGDAGVTGAGGTDPSSASRS
jgi:hypothetical protein